GAGGDRGDCYYRLFTGTGSARAAAAPDALARCLRQAQGPAAGLHALKGHRVVGGMRASIYNAMPLDGVKALTVSARPLLSSAWRAGFCPRPAC
ncbi:hypothetical protein FK513_30970, partial [Klebsiella pneumoniae]|nr:hypothetical protein [Klebsiella pneumoniae]